MLNFTLSGKRISIIKRLDKLKNIEIFSDRKRVKQIIMNLFTNALKFTENGSIKIYARLKSVKKINSS
jgi:signal transduction histidine kinase